MDFLNKFFEQVQAALKPMSTSAKITTALLLAVVVIGVVFLFQNEQLGGNEYLLGAHVFSQEELAAAVAAFAEAQLNDYSIENYRIRVPRSKRYQYIAAMSQSNAMPETAAELWTQMFNGGLLESREVRQWRNQYRKKRELERILANMSGVKQASVEFDVEASTTLMGQPKKSALVAVTPSAPRAIDASLIKSVREAAAMSLNMTPEEVGVLDMFANRTYRGDKTGAFAGGDDDYTAYKSIRENQLTKKLYDQLSFIPGPKINVQIELQPEVRHQIESVKFNDKPTALRSSTVTEEETSSNKPTGGRPGTAPNNDPAGFANSAASVAATTSETIRNVSREDQQSIVGQERTMREVLPFSPKDVTVSISIPLSYINKIWTTENPPAEGEEPVAPDPAQLQQVQDTVTSNVEEIVNNLLPRVEAGADPFPRVVVKFHHDLPVEPLEGPAQTAVIMEWLQDNMTTLGMAVFGIVGLVFLRGMIKSAQDSSGSSFADSALGEAGVGGGHSPSGDADDEDSELANSLRERFRSKSGPNLREELTDMVREDPDAAATVLSAWIGSESPS